jgi:hypothetical protein
VSDSRLNTSIDDADEMNAGCLLPAGIALGDADEMNAGCLLPAGRALGCTYFTAVVHSDNSSIRVNSLAHLPVSILVILFVPMSTSVRFSPRSRLLPTAGPFLKRPAWTRTWFSSNKKKRPPPAFINKE